VIRIILSILFAGAALVTFAAAVAVLIFYRWITAADKCRYVSFDGHPCVDAEHDEPVHHIDTRNVISAAFVSRPRAVAGRQTVADVTDFAERARRVRTRIRRRHPLEVR
jgi:hypothetical protein